MKPIATLICLLGILSLAACGADEDHSHDEGTASHSHAGNEVHANDGGQAYEHRNDDHAHDATATQAFYGDEADAVGAIAEPGAAAVDQTEGVTESEAVHTHGDGEPHTHDH